MPMVRAMRMLNALEAGMLDGAGLEALFTADPSTLGEFNVLLGMRGQAERIAASETTLSAVIASSTAMAAVIASPTAMAAIDANDQALRIVMLAGTGLSYTSYADVAALTASSTAMTAIAASSTARLAIYNSDTALNAISASTIAINALTSSPQYQTKTSLSFAASAQSMGLTGKAIILKVSQSWSDSQPSHDCVIEGLRSDTTIFGTRSIGSPPDGIYASGATPQVTWVLPAEANATCKNTYTSLGNIFHIGFIYV